MTQLILKFAEKIVFHFWNTTEVKEFVVELLKKYAKETDNEIDDIIVSVVEAKLLE
jgi:hypothetical protein